MITKRQHFVPRFYLSQWSVDGAIKCHDLFDERIFQVAPDNILLQRYLYEEDENSPDNRVENLLSDMETRTSIVLSPLGSVGNFEDVRRRPQFVAREVERLTPESTCDQIKEFISFQYLRVPSAIEQKRHELTGAKITPEQRDYWLNAGRFVDSGYAYISNKIRHMNMILMVSGGQDYITSDWPCFDMKDSDMAPILGEDIGVQHDVVLYFPLMPRISCVLYHPNFNVQSGTNVVGKRIVQIATDSSIRNQNTLVIQQASRRVICMAESNFVFKVAKKRRRSVNA